MSKVARKGDLWNQTVPTVTDSAIETVDGKDPGAYKRYEANGTRVSRELTVEIGAGMSLLSIQLLTRIARLMKLPAALAAPNKGTIIEAFQDLVIRSGVKLLVSQMTRATMKRISLVFGLPNTKQRNIVDHILRVGLPVFLHEKCDVPLFVDFCGILGLEAGKYVDPSSDPNSSANHDPNPPYITYNRTHGLLLSTNPVDGSFIAEPAPEDEEENDPTLRSNSHASFLAKSSAELERELADEIMLMGMEDLLRSLTVPTLHEIAVELNILPPPGSSDPSSATSSSHSTSLARDISREFALHPPREPEFYISIIMDHLFDLVPLQEYLKQMPVSVPSNAESIASSSSGARTTSNNAPSSPFMSSVENSKKRKATDPASLHSQPDLNSASPTTSTSISNGTNGHKKAKTAESDSTASPSAASSSADAPSESAMSTDDSPVVATPDPKRTRGKNASKASTSSISSATPSSSNTAASSSSSTQPSSVDADSGTANASTSHGTPGGKETKPSKKTGATGATTPSVAASSSSTASSKAVEEHSFSRTGEDEPTSEGEEAEETSVDEKSFSTPSTSRASRRAKTQALAASPSGSSHSQTKTPKSAGGKGAHSSGGKGGPKSPSVAEEEEEYMDDDDSSSEEEVRTTPTGGKGRAKYQAPPLTQIKKGITGQELHNLYNVTDLQEWCKLHKVDHTGKKSAVIKRILYTLDPVNTKPPPPKKARRFSSR